MWAGGWIVLFGFATTANRKRICLANKFQRHTDRILYRRLEREIRLPQPKATLIFGLFIRRTARDKLQTM